MKSGIYLIKGAKRDDKRIAIVLESLSNPSNGPAILLLSPNEEALLRQRIRTRNSHGMSVFVGTRVRITNENNEIEILPIRTMTDVVRDIARKATICQEAN